jgi:hypothetical protein
METGSLEKLLEAKLETVHVKLDSIKSKVIETNGRVKENDCRLTALEGFKMKAAAFVAGVVAVVQIVTNYIFG